MTTAAPPHSGTLAAHADLPATPATGLSEGEAARRRAAGLGNVALPPTTRTYRQILSENTFTFVNNILFLLGIALVVVGRPTDAVVSLAVISVNIVVGIVQEIRAKRTLDRIALLTRPTATTIRDGAPLELLPEDLVLGDLVEVRAGDQVVLDGRLASGGVGVDESQLTGESDVVAKRTGDEVFSGSVATTGTGRYDVETVASASFANRITAGARSFRRIVTPLQGEVNLVVRVVLGMVVYLEILLVMRGLVQATRPGEVVADATLLAGLVPNGLFVSIAVAYALGAIRILRFGALVQQANAIESLSHVDVLCLDKTGTLTANRLQVDRVVPLDDASEAEVLDAVAALAASATAGNTTSNAIAARWPAAPRPLSGEVPFSPTRKWSAVAFADAGAGDGRGPGIVALGAPQFLRQYLASGGPAPAGSAGAADQAVWDTIRAKLSTLTAQGLRVLLVATHPDASALPPDSDDASATLPAGMRALGLVALRDELRDEAAATLASFRANGVGVKIISGDDPETVVALARQAGIEDAVFVSGADLDELDDARLGAVAEETTVFGRITPAQKERLVDALRARGHYVAMIGDGVNDVLSLKKANLAIAMGSGTQATRGVADIVLMQDSFAAVAQAVEEGQRILNGMQDILKLFLTRIATVALAVISSLVVVAFPIELRNASALTIFTVGIPSVLLAFWAAPGRRLRASLTRTLATFVGPAATVSSLIGLFVLNGSLFLAGASGPHGQGFIVALDNARTALTAFLVFAGLLLILFVEPPTAWFAVAEPLTADRRPAILAIVLAVTFIATMVSGTARDFFSFGLPTPRDVALVVVAVVVWTLLVREAWRRQLVERFLGIADGGTRAR
ncbi:MAG: HAD-IC family P-type ATPase [Candidatus Limnocylindrales bacterium]